MERMSLTLLSEAAAYLPKRNTPLSVTVGVEEKTEIELNTFEHIKLSKCGNLQTTHFF